MWLTQLVERNRQCFPDRTALVDERRSATWAQFHDRTAELARGLAALGIERGDRVAVLSQDRIEVLETYFALARLGALFVPLNHSLAVPEVAGIIERVGAVAVLGESDLLDRHPTLPASVRIRMAFDVPAFDALGTLAEPVELPEVSDTDPVAVLHTSATTGQAKGVTVDAGSFRAIALGWLVSARPTDDIVMVNCCPLYHGSMVVSLTYLAAGATVVLMPGFTRSGRWPRSSATGPRTCGWSRRCCASCSRRRPRTAPTCPRCGRSSTARPPCRSTCTRRRWSAWAAASARCTA